MRLRGLASVLMCVRAIMLPTEKYFGCDCSRYNSPYLHCYKFGGQILEQLCSCLTWNVQNRLSVVDSYMNLLTFICSNVNQLVDKDSSESEAENRGQIRQKVDNLINQITKVLQNPDSMSTSVLMRIVWVVGHFVAPDTTSKVEN